MTSNPRKPLTTVVVEKGSGGAIPEPIPTMPAAAAPEAPTPRPIGTEVGMPAPLLMALTVRIPPDLGERLRAFAFVTRRGKGDLITEALTRFLDEVGG